jgi:hypothetical protein
MQQPNILYEKSRDERATAAQNRRVVLTVLPNWECTWCTVMVIARLYRRQGSILFQWQLLVEEQPHITCSIALKNKPRNAHWVTGCVTGCVQQNGAEEERQVLAAADNT